MNSEKTAKHFDLTGKVALVTGGTRGLGLAMARAFADAGASVVVSSRKAGACAEAARTIREDTGARCIGVPCHVADWDDCDALVAAAYGEFGKVDVLVNNAGMSPPYESLVSVSRELFDKVIGVNLAGPFRLSALVGTRMAAGEGGSIINISSTAAAMPTSSEIPYGAAKAGLQNMTTGLAHTFGPGVRCNCIMPGPFLTDISKAWDMAAMNDLFDRMIPLGRAGRADEIVGAALYLASDASSYTNGAIIKIDGGMSFAAS
ncbi:MAG: SDR family oxidoreductase [Gammaproteobacteria bacterium]|nr:SDR family oxidoreductase [Gammaproteobacteria bacterium]